MENKIIEFIIKNTSLSKDKISKIQRVNKGLTNKIFFLETTEGNKYKIRLASTNPYINRQLEQIVEYTIFGPEAFLFYDQKGDYIKKWIDGTTPSDLDICQSTFWSNIKLKIDQIHAIKIEDLTINNAIYYDDVIYNQLQDELILYKKIVDNFNCHNFCLSHNDCSLNNILIDKNKQLFIIDFEWMSLNHHLWDIANLIKDTGWTDKEINLYIPFINETNRREYFELIFCTYCYTYIWTTRVELTPEIKKYQELIIQQTHDWYNIIKKYGFN